MVKIKYVILLMIFAISTSAQNLVINLNLSTGQISDFYLYNDVGVFKISDKGDIEYIILGDYNAGDLDILDYYENKSTRAKFLINKSKIYVKKITEINYSNNQYIEEAYKKLPVNINGYKIQYYNSFYDSDFEKGKIKSIDNIKIEYYKAYYLDDNIKGRVKSIGGVNVLYSDSYYLDKIRGLIVKIGDVDIKYYTKEYYKNYLNYKLKSIGNCKIEYFDDNLNDSRNGEFKKISGTDSRFILINN